MLLDRLRLNRPITPRVWWFFVPSILLLIPFLNFATSNSYPLLCGEIALVASVLFVSGMLLGALGQTHRIAQAVVLAGTLTLLIDVQTRLLFDFSLYQYVWIPIGLLLVIVLLPKPAETALLVLVYAVLVVVLATPRRAPIAVAGVDGSPVEATPAGQQSEHAYWIHIILDEHTGIESIPLAFDPQRRLALRVRQDYVAGGFTVFGRAFTRYSQTHLSLPNIFNFSKEHPVSLLKADAETLALGQSSYLSRLVRQGFRVHIFESDYLGLCDGADVTAGVVCHRYRGNSIWGVYETEQPVVDKALLILGMYVRLSKVYTHLASRMPLDPRFSASPSVAPLVGLKVLGKFTEAVRQFGPGSAWIVHVLLPHGPYALQSNCTIRPLPWLDSGTDTGSGEWNTPDARKRKYPLYLEQLACAHQTLQELFGSLKRAGIYDNANIVVHGDHGSRIATHNLRERPVQRPDFVPSAETLLDYQGTLFAFKPAHKTTGEYRREMASVATLLDAAASPPGVRAIVNEREPHMYLVEWDSSCNHESRANVPGCRQLRIALPRFSDGTTDGAMAGDR